MGEHSSLSFLWIAPIEKIAVGLFCIYLRGCFGFIRVAPLFGHAQQLWALRFGQLEISRRLCLYDRVVAQDPSGICLDNLALCLASPFWPTDLVPWGKGEKFKRGILCLWFARMDFLGSWFQQGIAFPFLVGRSVFRSVGQADGSCLDAFYAGRGLDALEDEEGFFGQGSPCLSHADGLRFSRL